MATALFLDRDGVINEDKVGSYVFNLDEFHPLSGAFDALGKLTSLFDYAFVVTNQRGVGLGLMSEDDLNTIHRHVRQQIEVKGGKLDKFYFAAQTDRNHPYRKPGTGMAHAAKQDFPDIDFEKSVMVGNNITDMEFGKKMGMHTVFLTTTVTPFESLPEIIDEQYPSLMAFLNASDWLYLKK